MDKTKRAYRLNLHEENEATTKLEVDIASSTQPRDARIQVVGPYAFEMLSTAQRSQAESLSLPCWVDCNGILKVLLSPRVL